MHIPRLGCNLTLTRWYLPVSSHDEFGTLEFIMVPV